MERGGEMILEHPIDEFCLFGALCSDIGIDDLVHISFGEAVINAELSRSHIERKREISASIVLID